MRIKSLEIVGFKSFADPVRLSFGDGITGVVGPNGCGKSNIIDAIRWCMGEMSAKTLRGRGMQDVIFAGSDSRGGSGMAEVTLTFHNDGNAPPQYAAFSEIAVTRRLYRDGSSEYLVNKIQARLRDITDLFLGTGVGTRAYSIIEQGRIGFIVSAKPEDRRTLIEEVAGITRYKSRKKMAERRIEVTEQNLARVNDIITELDKQLGSLQRQAKKAERYKRVREELRHLDLLSATMELLRMRALETVQRGERDVLEQRLADAQRGVALEETRLEAERVRLLSEEERLRVEQEASGRLDAELAALERDLEHWKTQRADLAARTAAARRDVDEARGRISETESEQEELTGALAELEQQAQEDREQIEAAEAGVRDLTAAIAELDQMIERLRRDAVEHIHEAARQRTRLSHLVEQRAETAARLEQNATESTQIDEQRGLAVKSEAQLSARRGAVASELERFRARLETLRIELARVSEELVTSDRGIDELRQSLADKRSRLESLLEIARRLEGFSDGVRSLLRPEAGGPAVSGLLGLVADVVQTAPRFERAIEAALGERLQYLIVDGHESATAALEFLKSAQGGRSGFVPLAPRLGTGAPVPAPQPGVLGSAVDCVQVAPEHAALVRELLGEVVVVEDRTAALRLFGAGVTAILVTLDGDVLEPSGVAVGGSNEGTGLLAKRREIRELDDAVRSLEAELAQARAAHEALETARLQTDVDIQQLDKDRQTTELELVETAKDVEAAKAALGRLVERAEVLDLERSRLAADAAEIDRETAESSDAAQTAERAQHEIEQQIQELGSVRKGKAGELEGRNQALLALKVQLASRDEKLAGSRAHGSRLSEARADFESRITRGEQQIAEGERAVTELLTRIAAGDERAKELAGRAVEERRKLGEARARYSEEQKAVGEIEQAIRSGRRECDLLAETLTQLKMEMQRQELDRSRLLEQIAERHDVDLLKVAGDYHMLPPPGPDELARRAELDRSIKAMGPINLTAIEECAEVEKRYAFLTAQRDDLVSALESLRRAMQKINRASRERFQEAFEAVNEMFKKVFPKLFLGGEARLELLPSDDILEAGVDIIAQPPGKKLQNVGLLSGGEKALTAAALVFAIFLIKPSPFCVLDEVDAPLDEANVGRFNDMLREISKISQFIIITHNKLTMTRADRLYGVTMEEPGMSKIVSVDLERERRADAA